ncbi:hypothetical protein [Xanthocytophaga agilis]|uniref:Uncharacterized protein n=1 Tax=Xanthocytophaga agilis TaxID=3048010 RepID=A0AAE3UF66_9BACT|nr:hypothetical protein [Xanthocytophaga agilis]MDJ1500238.1 hypothetical protein [Xanthocytophaga agilis]
MSELDPQLSGAKLIKKGLNGILVVNTQNIRFLIKPESIHCVHLNPDMTANFASLEQMFAHANKLQWGTKLTHINQIQIQHIFRVPGSAPDNC